MSADKMEIFNRARECPETAKTPITSGRLAELGFSDINPVWRFERLTEIFGPVGIGWRYKIHKMWMEAPCTGEIVAFVTVALSYRLDNENWSEEFEGTGGAFFACYEENALVIKKDCYKAALTDAIGVACKPLGIAADVYYGKNKINDNQTPEGETGNDSDLPFTCGPKPSQTQIPEMPQPQPRQGMSKEEALRFIVKIGSYRQNPKTVREVLITDVRSSNYYMSDKFEPNYDYGKQLKEAFLVATSS